MNRIPVKKIIDELDSLFSKNDMEKAGGLLEKWERISRDIGDVSGEITIQSELVGYYRKTAEKEKALRCVERALSLISLSGQEDTISGATVLLNCATTMKAFNKSEDALPLYQKARSVFEKRLDKKDPLHAGFCNNFALALADLKRYKEAEELYECALEALKGTPKELDCAVTYVNMAHLYEEWQPDGFREKISHAMENALLSLCDTSLERNGYMAFVYSKCAPSFSYFGDEDTAGYLQSISDEIYAKNREKTDESH